MNLDLKNKTALITGSSAGVGLGIATAMHEAGCKVILNGRNSEILEVAIKSLPGSRGIVADVTSPAGPEALLSGVLGMDEEIDILICNVGSGVSVPPGEETLSEWRRVFEVNFWSTISSIETFEKMLAKKQGAIVCISSICGIEVIPGAPLTYSVAKSALNSFVKGVSRPMAKKGIRINAVAPGNILFDGSSWDKKIKADSLSVESMLDENVSLAKLGSVKDVGDLVTYLASPVSQFVTGAVWTVDGGQIRS